VADAGAPPGDGRYALFPLGVVLFPGGLLPLRIFEPRYQRMVGECLRSDRPFVVAAILDGPEAGGVAMPAATGTLARIIDWEQLDDGLLGLLCEGGQQVAIGATEVESDKLLRASVTTLHAAEERPLPTDLAWTAGLLDELLDRIGAPFDRLKTARPSADHVVNRLTELLPLPLAEKRRLFEIPDGLARLQHLVELITPDRAS
jgi:Lon protease-like protein